MDIIELIISSSFFQTLSVILLHFIWQALAITFSVFVLLKIVNNQYAHARYLICLAALIICLIAPCLTSLFLSYSPESEIIFNSSELDITKDILTGSDSYPTDIFDYLPIMSLIWIAGVIYFSIKLIVQLYYTSQLPKQSSVLPNEQLQLLFNTLQQKINVTKRAKLLISLKAEVPMVIGWLKPIVLLPLSMSTGLSLQQIEMLLAHELAHIKRYDYLVNLIQTMVEVLFFFHPAVFWLSKQIRAEREYCCDDAAIACCGTPLAYANTLTNAELLRPHHIPTLAMAASGGDLLTRVNRMITQHHCTSNNKGSSTSLAGLLIVFVFVCLVSTHKVLAMFHTEQSAIAQNIETNLVTQNSTAPIKEQTLETQLLNETLEVNLPANKIAPSIKPIILSSDASVVVNKTYNSASNIELKDNSKATTVVDDKLNDSKLKPITRLATVEQNDLKEPIIQRTITKTLQESPIKTAQAIKQLKASEVTVSASKLAKLTNSVEEPETLTPPQKNKEATNLEPTKKQNLAPKEQSAKLIHFVTPSFPKLAVVRKKESPIEVHFTINAQGEVTNINFTNGRRVFTKAIEKALAQWKFNPKMVDGVPVATQLSRTFNFSNEHADDVASIGSRIKRI
ncbi:M56 family metallopeptidase [Pseudoalteromonas tunicata]|uniref:TonB domain/peptidase M56 domain protein n=1 Tax=Pseudoalteromonas tunicata D2 TaxID=87626 RepID=A4C6V0_9GAMM|nr:M56 family metallopeptidase [Pseudoalteromonas tunicata]AXT31236.1 hypothetical protein D1819_10725 [Pseudoalteromonas tunicata]EAR29704.1 TonB domain/peptidase M56 domain protein [Pseudoalteromonas tunicata D2]